MIEERFYIDDQQKPLSYEKDRLPLEFEKILKEYRITYYDKLQAYIENYNSDYIISDNYIIGIFIEECGRQNDIKIFKINNEWEIIVNNNYYYGFDLYGVVVNVIRDIYK